MKRFGLFLVLFFAYFVCVCDVYATTVDSIVRWTGYTTNHIRGYRYGEVNSEWDYFFTYNYCDTPDTVYSCNIIDNNATVFGYYSNGNIIRYTKPNQNAIDSPNYLYGGGLYYYKNIGSYISDQGYVTTVVNYESTDYVDFVLSGPFYVSGSSIRADFSIHINFNSIPSNIRKTIINNLYVMPNSGSGATTYCDSTYSVENERINVSCAFIDDGSDLVVRLKNNLKAYTDLESSSYFYHTYFDISDVTYVMSTSDNFDDLDTDSSPSGSIFNDTYNKITTNSTNYFDNFYSPNFNGLTRIIASPLTFISNLRTDSESSLTISLFNKNIDLKSGNTLFWNKFFYNDTPTCDSECLNDMKNAFKSWWGNFFGAILIYLSAVKLFKVCLKLYSPTNNDVEVF